MKRTPASPASAQQLPTRGFEIYRDSWAGPLGRISKAFGLMSEGCATISAELGAFEALLARRDDREGGESGVAAPRRRRSPPRGTETAVDLLVAIPNRRVRLWGTEIPAKPPKNLQPQLFFALAALALNANISVSMTTLAQAVQHLGRYPRKTIAPDARDLRYRILRTLRLHVRGHRNEWMLEGLLENVQGDALRLNCTAQVIRSSDELSVTDRPTGHA